MKKIISFLLAVALIVGIANANIIGNIAANFKMNKCTLLTKDVPSTTIPFTMEHGWIVITVTVTNNGKTYKKLKFLLDTGSSTLFFSDFANAAGMNKEDIQAKMETYADKSRQEKTAETTDPSIIQIGDMKIEQDHVLINPSNDKKLACMGINGFIGSNTLSKFIMQINFNDSTITLYNQKKFNANTIDKSAKKISFIPRVPQNIPQSFLTVGDKTFFAIWDLGYNGGLSLEYKNNANKKIQKLVKEIANDPKTVPYTTYGGLSNINGAIKSNITLYEWKDAYFSKGDNKFSVKHAEVFNNQADNSLSIGASFASQYQKMIIDWNTYDIYLISPKTDTAKDTNLENVIVRYVPKEQKTFVTAINTQSSFYRKGLKCNEEVTDINGQSLSVLKDMNTCDVDDKLKQLKKDIRSITVLRNGQPVTITE